MFGRGKLHYAWVVAAVTFVTLLVGGAMRATPGLLIVPLENEFQWSRATISFAVGVNILGQLHDGVHHLGGALLPRRDAGDVHRPAAVQFRDGPH